MAELTDFLPYVRRHISGPLSIMMTDALSMSAVAFCRQSLLCRREATLSPSAGEDCVLPYDAENEECVHIIRLLAERTNQMVNYSLISVALTDRGFMVRPVARTVFLCAVF